ncbi:MAG: hypothetical protein HYS12_02515 [Planctomycetes bacterium]|nr:hypothetical protein [Planctomycetota bacterium]
MAGAPPFFDPPASTRKRELAKQKYDRLHRWLARDAAGGVQQKDTPAPSPSTPPAAPATGDLALTREDVALLRALAASHPRTVSQYDLETTTGFSRRTIGPRLSYLRSAGLAHQPRGKRKGHTVTAEGLRLFASLPAE